ncbi:Na-H exchanger [Tieghemostelium lacteum]|uniref:Na-H exchanger n=1 Tax=Tieghemostelium lacteum TaxID=361077 RepID=A0A152A1Q7_TIELA|nr:Na-H exchanger [Tieghemostelium lacteum]|eukprot:KYR00025.1 Na-H exchanger [Tieghemostelium lacteum]
MSYVKEKYNNQYKPLYKKKKKPKPERSLFIESQGNAEEISESSENDSADDLEDDTEELAIDWLIDLLKLNINNQFADGVEIGKDTPSDFNGDNNNNNGFKAVSDAEKSILESFLNINDEYNVHKQKYKYTKKIKSIYRLAYNKLPNRKLVLSYYNVFREMKNSYNQFRISDANLKRFKTTVLPHLYSIPSTPKPIENTIQQDKPKSQFHFPPTLPFVPTYSDLLLHERMMKANSNAPYDRSSSSKKDKKKKKHPKYRYESSFDSEEGTDNNNNNNNNNNNINNINNRDNSFEIDNGKDDSYNDEHEPEINEEIEKIVTMPVGTPIPLLALQKKQQQAQPKEEPSSTSSSSFVLDPDLLESLIPQESNNNNVNMNNMNNMNNNMNYNNGFNNFNNNFNTMNNQVNFNPYINNNAIDNINNNNNSNNNYNSMNNGFNNNGFNNNQQEPNFFLIIQKITQNPMIFEQVKQMYNNQKAREIQLLHERNILEKGHIERRKHFLKQFNQELIDCGDDDLLKQALRAKIKNGLIPLQETNQEELQEMTKNIAKDLFSMIPSQQSQLQQFGIPTMFTTSIPNQIDSQSSLLMGIFPSLFNND